MFAQVVIKVARCNTADPTCANDTVFAQYEQALGRFNYSMQTHSMIINPGKTDYLVEYYNDKTFFSFTSQQGN